jgi:hypothetical protein
MAKIYKLREGIEYFEKNPKGNYGDLYVNVDGSVINKLEKSLNWLKFNGNNYKFKIN